MDAHDKAAVTLGPFLVERGASSLARANILLNREVFGAEAAVAMPTSLIVGWAAATCAHQARIQWLKAYITYLEDVREAGDEEFRYAYPAQNDGASPAPPASAAPATTDEDVDEADDDTDDVNMEEDDAPAAMAVEQVRPMQHTVQRMFTSGSLAALPESSLPTPPASLLHLEPSELNTLTLTVDDGEVAPSPGQAYNNWGYWSDESESAPLDELYVAGYIRRDRSAGSSSATPRAVRSTAASRGSPASSGSSPASTPSPWNRQSNPDVSLLPEPTASQEWNLLYRQPAAQAAATTAAAAATPIDEAVAVGAGVIRAAVQAQAGRPPAGGKAATATAAWAAQQRDLASAVRRSIEFHRHSGRRGEHEQEDPAAVAAAAGVRTPDSNTPSPLADAKQFLTQLEKVLASRT